MKVNIITLGCKVNQYESQAMLSLLEKDGYTACRSESDADIVIVNSCTVTAASDQKVRQTVRKVKKNNPDAVIVLTGCMPQAFPEESAKLIEADIVIGNTKRNDICGYIERYLKDKDRIVEINEHEKNEIFEPLYVDDFHGRTRAFLKVEDGCNRFCSYCIIPYARGRVRSKPLSEIEKEVKKIAESGYKEIVLTGINLPAYGDDISLKLCDAVEAVCAQKGIIRVRLGSLEPERLDPTVIERLRKQDKLCPQFHLSLQSGSDNTLRRMNRHYTTKEYIKIVNDLREAFQESSITTDIMVGFSGETDIEFNESLEFAKQVGFARAHIFQYSRRPGTKAYDLENIISNSEKEARSRKMIEVTDKTKLDFHRSQCGKVYEVLFEQKDKNGMYEGYTKNYTLIKVRSDENLHGKLLNVLLKDAYTEYCSGEILKDIP